MTSVNPDYEAIAEFMALQSDSVRTNSQIVDADLVGQPYMLHIDKNTPKVFTPMMPRSADPREDNTIARITVAPTLIGCYIGYQRGHDNFLEGSKKDPEDTDSFRGGYEICLLPFQHCLKVNNTLVPDASLSGEHWLVGYTEETREYKPEHVGKVFVSKITQKAVSGDAPATFLTIYIEVKREQGFKFSPNIHMTPGYWKATVLWNAGEWPNCEKEGNFDVKHVSQEEYESAKHLSAAMLSMESQQALMKKAPAFTRW